MEGIQFPKRLKSLIQPTSYYGVESLRNMGTEYVGLVYVNSLEGLHGHNGPIIKDWQGIEHYLTPEETEILDRYRTMLDTQVNDAVSVLRERPRDEVSLITERIDKSTIVGPEAKKEIMRHFIDNVFDFRPKYRILGKQELEKIANMPYSLN